MKNSLNKAFGPDWKSSSIWDRKQASKRLIKFVKLLLYQFNFLINLFLTKKMTSRQSVFALNLVQFNWNIILKRPRRIHFWPGTVQFCSLAIHNGIELTKNSKFTNLVPNWAKWELKNILIMITDNAHWIILKNSYCTHSRFHDNWNRYRKVIKLFWNLKILFILFTKMGISNCLF